MNGGNFPNQSQDISGFVDGLCSLSIHDTNIEVLEGRPPIQMFGMNNNQNLKAIDAYSFTLIDKDQTPHEMVPHMLFLTTENNSLLCSNLESIPEDINNLKALSDGFSIGCYGYKSMPYYQVPGKCSPDLVQTLNVYQDTNTQRRFITWEKDPNDDYNLWGVISYELKGYDNFGNVIMQRQLPLDFQKPFVSNNLAPTKYTISACTADQCGYETTVTEADFGQGLTRVTDVSVIWDTSVSGSFTHKFQFKYPQTVYNSPYGKPTKFVITPDFIQPLGYPTEEVVLVAGNVNSDNMDSWYSDVIFENTYIGTNFTIKACSDELGCGAPTNVTLGNPITDTDIIPPLVFGATSNINGGPTIGIGWNMDVYDQKIPGTEIPLVDYIEVTETQPYINPTQAFGAEITDRQDIVYYVERGTSTWHERVVTLTRLVKGEYSFKFKACHRDRVHGDTCSASTNSITRTLDRLDKTTPPLAPTRFEFATYADTGLTLVWDENPLVDYYHITVDYLVSGRACAGFANTFIVQNSKTNEFPYAPNGASTFNFKKMSSVKSCPNMIFPLPISGVPVDGKWLIQACYNGLGCGLAAELSSLDEPLGSINYGSTSQAPSGSNAGGPGDMNPGVWWNPKLSGTGWHFYWASELRYPSTHEKYGNTYDLIGVWLTYKLQNGEWTPIWIFSQLKLTQGAEIGCVPSVSVNCSQFFEGSLQYVSKNTTNHAIETKSLGRLQVYFDVNGSGDNDKVILKLDIDSENGILTQKAINTLPGQCLPGAIGPNCLSIDANGNLDMPLTSFEQSIIGNSFVGSEKNDIDHYSGMWWNFVNNFPNNDFSYLVDINKNLEWSALLFYDFSGDPIWAISDSCQTLVNSVCERTHPWEYSSSYHVIERGFDPLSYTPSDWTPAANLIEVGTSSDNGRKFNANSSIGFSGQGPNFRETEFWTTLNVPSLPGGRSSAVLSYGTQNNPVTLSKAASFHDIRFFINGQKENVTTCNPNTEGECVVNFTWFTDDDFPNIKPYYIRTFSGTNYPLTKLSNLCQIPTPTGQYVETDYTCTISDPGQYTFQLRKPTYATNDGNASVQIAESEVLDVLVCTDPINCEISIETPTLFMPAAIVDVGFYTISWSPSQNAVSYILQESTDASIWETVYEGLNLETLITGQVENGATYYYRVQACDSNSCSTFSPVSQISVVFNCSANPSVPDTGDFIQQMETFGGEPNRSQASLNASVIPELDGIKIPETYILGVPNEKINILNASVTYEYNDIVIPGSNGLDLIVKRELGEFQMVSKVEGFKVEYCSGALINDRLSVFIEGKSLISVGYGSSSDLPIGTLVSYREGYFLRCNQLNFPEVVSPDGKIYTFGKTLDNGSTVPYRYFVTEVKDEFNNAITFSYGNDFPYFCTNFLNLESMSRNDGARIDIEYVVNSNLPFISKAKYGGRETNYDYEFINNIDYKWKLTSYLDQENRETQYEYYSVQPLLKKVSMPSGLKVEYEYAPLDPDFGFNNELTHRKISGPDIPTNSISYIYGDGEVNYTNLWITQRFDDYALIRRIAFRDSALIDPDANNELHSDYVMIGTIKSDTYFYDDDPVDIHNELEVLYRETNLWSPSRFGGVGCPQINDAPVGGTNDYFRICARPLLLEKIFAYQVKNGATNSYDIYKNEYPVYDKYGYLNFAIQSKVNSTTDKRYIKQFYNHDTQNWILGQPTTTQVSADNINWTETTQNSYWPKTSAYKSKLKYQYQHGQKNKYYQQYHATGDLKRVNTSGTNYYEMYNNYKRGVAQTTTIPMRYSNTGTQSKYKTANIFGEIISETDYIGTVTDYSYDKLSRNTFIDYNQCDVVNNCTLQNDVITYNDMPNTVTTTKGVYKEIKAYDSLLRIKTESIQDSTDVITKVTNSYDYGVNGTLDYQSFPSNGSLTLNGTGNGIEYEYDYLNRKTRETVFDSTRTTIRDFEYLKDNKVRLTDGNGFQTTIEYLSYGASTYSNPLNISQQVTSTPSYVTTAINYNLFDNISTVTQGGITETRIYDNNQQLCKVRRPDVGVTAYGYYSSGLLNWQANGTTGDTNVCGGETASDKITYSYNNQNELWTKSDANGTIQTNTTTLVTNTGIVTKLDNSDTHLTLSYNKNNQLVTKVMDASPFNTNSPGDGTTSWQYDDMGYISTTTYPESDSMLTYINNALGQVTSVSETNNGADYFNISNISYHPSGGLNSYTLGNGITRTIARKNSGLPQSIIDTKAANTFFSHSYAYDNESNLSSLTDGVNTAYSLSGITYDGLNRLKTLTGNWGASNFNYDNLSNITQMKLGSQTLDYVYGTTNNRLESTTGSAQFSFQYDSSGNITNNGFRTFDYGKQNRLITSQNVSFIHDGEDLIHSKSVVGEPTKCSLYGANQDILFKFGSDNYGTVYYYLNDKSVANVKITSTGRELTYQHNDALSSLAVETDNT